jgi:hypothetical protein
MKINLRQNKRSLRIKDFKKIRYYKFLEENRLYYVVVAQIEANYKKEKRKL